MTVVENRDYKGEEKNKHFLVSALVLSRNLRKQIVDAQKIKKRRKKNPTTIIHATFAFWL